MQPRNKEKQRASQEDQAHCAPKPQRKTRNVPSEVTNSIMERNFLWLGGTTTNNLTPEINLSRYARETKHLTLRDTESYLVPNG